LTLSALLRELRVSSCEASSFASCFYSVSRLGIYLRSAICDLSFAPTARVLRGESLPWLPRALAVWSLLHLLMAGCGAQPPAETDYARERHEMVEKQLAGAGRNIRNRRVLDAMASVPRHEFVPPGFRRLAYQDEPLPIGFQQTISQPYIVAFMTEALDPKPADRVLEIGTGSGYQAAVLSKLVAEVYTIEIITALAERARTDLERLGYSNVKVRAGDGYQGWPEHAPFDAIIVTCAPEQVPQPLVDQLMEGGRMIIPVGGSGDVQQLYLLRKRGGKTEQQAVLAVRFVPMRRGAAQ
jgi:protein-L-isoaspartate(D-aspartate) O-methyltransferase